MTKWEYKVIDVTDEDHYIGHIIQDFLNSLGKDGWELVSIKKNRYVFKCSKNVLDDKKWVTKPTTITWYYDNDKETTEINYSGE
jgi:hypothetical protein